MSEWTKVGPTWQRLYANGVLGIVHFTSALGRHQGCEAYPSGELQWPVSGSGADCQKALDKANDPQPDLVERGDDFTFMRHGKQSAYAKLNGNGNWTWYMPKAGSESRKTREEAESEIRKHVLGH